MSKTTDPLTRVLNRVEIDPVTECWVWQGSRGRGGYGLFALRSGVNRLVHRWVYEQLIGPIPVGLELDHLCFNPPCCSPAHLEPVTRLENIRRRPSGAFSGDSDAMQALANRYEAGASTSALAAEYGVSEGGILDRVRRAGGQARRVGAPRKPTGGVVDEYLNGEVPSVIAARYGVSEETVRRRVKAAGVPLRPRGGQVGSSRTHVTDATR